MATCVLVLINVLSMRPFHMGIQWIVEAAPDEAAPDVESTDDEMEDELASDSDDEEGPGGDAEMEDAGPVIAIARLFHARGRLLRCAWVSWPGFLVTQSAMAHRKTKGLNAVHES